MTAATTSSEDARVAVLRIVNSIIQGTLPYLVNARLLPFAKPSGVVRPSAIGEVRYLVRPGRLPNRHTQTGAAAGCCKHPRWEANRRSSRLRQHGC